ncbi:MAG: histidine--tRNA ligase [Bacteroidetes bacterium]|nr:MAG: histidine--tRNA ligase [Bacteroidota bacterium]
MSLQKPSIPKGTRDFSPLEMVRRNYIFDTIRKVFQLFGYQPIETPAMENLSTLLGKYGEEGDKLLFKILNSGDFLDTSIIRRDENGEWRMENPASSIQHPASGAEQLDYKVLLPRIAEKGLRYDLTVPFARFVVQHQNEITFPFKRYQIQPVWRADRPQKGRYREFFQCDVDVIGSDSLLNEVELIQIVDKVFSSLGVKFIVKLNNRKILSGIAEVIGEPDRLIGLTITLDKLEKIEKAYGDFVLAELREKGFAEASITELMPFLDYAVRKVKDFDVILPFLRTNLKTSPIGLAGIEEIEKISSYLQDLHLSGSVELDISLARGLNYYTGTIIEVKAADVPMGSLCGGGRYDDLTGVFGLKGVSGVGISFGADRIYDVMNEMNLFPEMIEATTKVLFVNFGAEEEKYCLPLLAGLRESGIPAEIFPDVAKLKKQLDYANRKKIPFVVLVGENEMKEGRLTIKDMHTGEQETLTWEQLKDKLAS